MAVFDIFKIKSGRFFLPGWCGMTSPVYSALPQELLLDVDPMRPEGKTFRYFSEK